MTPFRTLLVLAAVLQAAHVHAQFVSVPLDGGARPTGSGVGAPNLVLDDGVPELAVGLTNGGEFLWFNQFAPPDADFPVRIDEVEVYFDREGSISVGDTFDVYLYYSTEPSPSLGAVFLGSLTDQTVAVLDTFDVRPAPPSLVVTQPADILIGIVNRGMAGAEQNPATIDITTNRDSSWVGLYEPRPPDPPTIPAPLMGRASDAGLPGNWLIRGTYVTVPLAGEPRVERRVRMGAPSPNPLRGQGTVPFELHAAGQVRLSIHDALGREVAVLIDGLIAPGSHRASLAGAGLPPGVYAVKLRAAGETATRTITVAR